MLVALPNEAFQGNSLLITVIIIVYSSIYFLFMTRTGKEFIQKKFADPFKVSLALLILINIFFISSTGSFSVIFLGKSLSLLIPAIFIYFFKVETKKFHPLDIVPFLLIYLIVVLKILDLPLINQINLVTFNGGYSIIVLYLLFLFIGYRKIEMGLEFKFTTKMLLITLLFVVILIPIDIILGQKMNFITFSGWNSSFKNAGILAVFMVFFAAMSEEIFFRGLIYNYLAQYLGKQTYFIPLIISSIIFGATHLDKFGMPMFFLSTIAGFFYGLTYVKTKNLFCAVFIHTLTNLCWLLFFITNN